MLAIGLAGSSAVGRRARRPKAWRRGPEPAGTRLARRLADHPIWPAPDDACRSPRRRAERRSAYGYGVHDQRHPVKRPAWRSRRCPVAPRRGQDKRTTGHAATGRSGCLTCFRRDASGYLCPSGPKPHVFDRANVVGDGFQVDDTSVVANRRLIMGVRDDSSSAQVCHLLASHLPPVVIP
jgi:hypothetical protein